MGFAKIDSKQYNVWLNYFKNKLLSEYNNLIQDSDCSCVVNKFKLKPIKNIDEVKDVYKDSLIKAREWLEYELISKFVSKKSSVVAVFSKFVSFGETTYPVIETKIFTVLFLKIMVSFFSLRKVI